MLEGLDERHRSIHHRVPLRLESLGRENVGPVRMSSGPPTAGSRRAISRADSCAIRKCSIVACGVHRKVEFPHTLTAARAEIVAPTFSMDG